MTNRKFKLHDGKKGAALAVRLTPKASRNKIVGVAPDGTVKIHLTASSVDDDATPELMEFLCGVLGVDRSRLDLVAGENGHDKLVAVLDMKSEDVHKRIMAYVD